MNDAEARQLLGVTEVVSPTELKSAYRNALKTWHPDLHQGEASTYAHAITRTQRINAAYEVLGGAGDATDDRNPAAPADLYLRWPVRRYYREDLLVWAGNIFVWGGLVAVIVITTMLDL